MAEDRQRYWPYYCEENVWHLCATVGGQYGLVAFVSNAARRVAMWGQRAAAHPGEPVLWDYHVVLLARGRDDWRVWDLDSTLGLDIPLAAWLSASFEAGRVPDPLRPRFRLVPADAFRRRFSSDRRHMRGPGGAFAQPPPPWETIGEGHNLDRFVDMRDSAFLGELFDLPALRRRLGVSSDGPQRSGSGVVE